MSGRYYDSPWEKVILLLPETSQCFLFFPCIEGTVSQSPDLLNVGSTSRIKSIVPLIAGYWREKFEEL